VLLATFGCRMFEELSRLNFARLSRWRRGGNCIGCAPICQVSGEDEEGHDHAIVELVRRGERGGVRGTVGERCDLHGSLWLANPAISFRPRQF